VTLSDWFAATWFAQHWVLFAAPMIALYGATAAFALSFFGGMATRGLGSFALSVLIYSHVALGVASVIMFFYQLFLVFRDD
jgi:hypothetical protein